MIIPPQIHQAVKVMKKHLQKVYPGEEAQSLAFLAMEHLTGLKPSFQLLPDSGSLSELQVGQAKEILERLLQSEPLQYILGYTEFYGMRFRVSPAVLIPRQETEELVRWVVNENAGKALNIVDLGTGSGCIAVALKKNLPEARMCGVDVSEDALNIARINAQLNEVEVEFIRENILDPQNPVLIRQADVLVSNPPYVTRSEEGMLQANVLEHEPHLALFVDDDDPLLFYQRIFELQRNRKSGCIYFEINEFLTDRFEDWLKNEPVQFLLRKDLDGKFRMLKIWW